MELDPADDVAPFDPVKGSDSLAILWAFPLFLFTDGGDGEDPTVVGDGASASIPDVDGQGLTSAGCTSPWISTVARLESLISHKVFFIESREKECVLGFI